MGFYDLSFISDFLQLVTVPQTNQISHSEPFHTVENILDYFFTLSDKSEKYINVCI